MFTRIKKAVKNAPFKQKLLFIVLFNAIAICLCSALGYALFSQAYNQLLYQAVANNLASSADTIAEKLDAGQSLSYDLLSNTTVQVQLTAMQHNADALQRSNASRQLNDLLSGYQNSHRNDGVDFIALYNAQFVSCTNWAHLEKIDAQLLADARQRAEDVSGSAAFTLDTENGYLLITRTVRKIANMDLSPIGDLLIALDMQTVVENATTTNSMFDNSYYILDTPDGQLIYASPALDDADIDFYTTHVTAPYQTTSRDGHSFFVLRGQLPGYGITYLNLVPFDSVRNYQLAMLAATITLLVLGFVFVAFITQAFVRYLLRQFQSLVDKMNAFAANEMALLPHSAEASQKDELGALHLQFETMAGRIQNLIQENYVNELLKKEAQLTALRAQINPHFLYNTLESINVRAKASGDTDISRITESLGVLLRSSLSDSRRLVTLQDEWNLVQSYMIIQKIRYEDQVEYSLSDIANIAEAALPPLTVQPLVENAIRYGLEEMIDACHIFIHARRDGDLLRIEVGNEGSEFEPDLLERLRSGASAPSGNGIGLLNIEKRIHLLFGEEYGLTFRNENGYAIAAITLPYQTEMI